MALIESKRYKQLYAAHNAAEGQPKAPGAGTTARQSKAARIALSLLTAIILIFTAACGNSPDSKPALGGNVADSEVGAKLSVVTSFYPLYFLASEIGGEHVNVVNLIAAGVEPHDWTPKSRDLITASNAQLFLYHGAGLEGWVDDFLKGLSKDSGLVAKEMSAGIKLIKGSDEEGAGEADLADEADGDHDHDADHAHEADGDHDHDADHAHEADGDHDHDADHAHGADGDHDHDADHAHGADDGHGHSHSHDTDPHTWSSPKSMLILAENIKNSLVAADAEHEADYVQNYEALKQKLTKLDEEYSAKLGQVTQKNIVVSHQAFGYLARDYGLNQVSIMGLNPDAEPRSQDILKIATFVKENDVKYIFFEELISDQMAKMLASEAGVDVMVLNPLEGLTKEQEKNGDTLLTLMERNLQNLLIALQ